MVMDVINARLFVYFFRHHSYIFYSFNILILFATTNVVCHQFKPYQTEISLESALIGSSFNIFFFSLPENLLLVLLKLTVATVYLCRWIIINFNLVCIIRLLSYILELNLLKVLPLIHMEKNYSKCLVVD
jgi:hypothetical protein